MTTYRRAWLSRKQDGRKTIYIVEVPAAVDGQYKTVGSFDRIERAEEYAKRIAETVVRIEV